MVAVAGELFDLADSVVDYREDKRVHHIDRVRPGAELLERQQRESSRQTPALECKDEHERSKEDWSEERQRSFGCVRHEADRDTGDRCFGERDTME